MGSFVTGPASFILVVVYAPLMSFKAMKAVDKTHDRDHWLAFWVTWSLFEALDSLTMGFLWTVMPFFSEIRFGFLVFCSSLEEARSLSRNFSIQLPKRPLQQCRRKPWMNLSRIR